MIWGKVYFPKKQQFFTFWSKLKFPFDPGNALEMLLEFVKKRGLNSYVRVRMSDTYSMTYLYNR